MSEKQYLFCTGMYATWARQSIGARIAEDKCSNEPIRSTAHAACMAEDLSPYDIVSETGAQVFEVREARIQRTHGDFRYPSSVIIVRAIPWKKIFGPDIERCAETALAVMSAKMSQVERFVTEWMSLPEGWEHCTHDDGSNCGCSEAPGSRASLAYMHDMTAETIPVKEYGIYAGSYPVGKQPINHFARQADRIWWLRAGESGRTVADEGDYSTDHAHAPWPTDNDVNGLPYAGAATQGARALISSADVWRHLPPAERATWKRLRTTLD